MTNRNKNILLGVLIVGVISMTIAFAALSTNLRINGTTNVAATRWNIHFQQWALDTQSTITVNGNTQHNTAEYPQVNQLTMQDNSNVTKVSGINVTLHQPNDYVRYTFQIINEGTIDADLQGFTHNLECESGKTCEFMEYEVNCYDNASLTGTALTTNSTLTANGGLAYCYLQVKYKDITNGDISKTNTANKVQANVAGTDQRYTQSATSATLSAQWTWVQATQANNNQGGNSGGSENNEPSVSYETLVPGDGYEVSGYIWNDAESSEYGNLHEYNGNDKWRSSLNPESRVYLRTNGTTPEVCASLGSGTVCMTSSYYNSDYSSLGSYASDFEDSIGGTYNSINISESGLKGYAMYKAEEMLRKGASSCLVDYWHENELICRNDNDFECYLDTDEVRCYTPYYENFDAQIDDLGNVGFSQHY